MGFEFTSKVDLNEQGKDAVKRSIDLLNGKPTPKGKQTIIMDPSAVGVFIHEAFGHANEADSVSQRRSFLYGLIGQKIASDNVTLYCDPTIHGEVGSYPYDSEGTPGRYTVLVERGIFKSYMHSRETAAFFRTEPTGNARAQDFSLPPIVRMNNLCLKPGSWKLDEIITDTKHGILIEGSRGGMEDPERGGFQFSAQNCYLIENGEIVSPLKDVSISGMTIEALKSIDAVADNFYLHPGHCGKGEPGVMQSVVVTDGGPHIRVNNILVGVLS
jgi:TldD protein